MLNYSCKKVLNCLIKIQKQNIEFNGRKTLNQYLPKWIIKNIDYIMFYLSDNKYITYDIADDDYYDFELTYKGLAYKSFLFEEFKAFLFKSVFIPILVSVVTTLITYTITMLFQH